MDSGENITMLTSPKIKPGERINLLMKRKRSELEGRSENRMEGKSSASLAVELTFSSPGILCGRGAQTKVTGIEVAVKVIRREWIRVTSGWEENG